MWWWLLGVLACVLLVAVIVFFLTTGRRYKVFSEKNVRPPAPFVTDSRQRDDRLKRGEKGNMSQDPTDRDAFDRFPGIPNARV